MRYAVVSDIHANLEALRAVLQKAEEQGADRLVCLGDHVGYNADPDACVELLRGRVHATVMGNHDKVAARLAEPDRFGMAARHAILWTREHISERTRGWLAELPITAIVDGRFLAFHAALHPTPNVDLHLNAMPRVEASFDAFVAGGWGVRLGFFGHTHHGVAYERRGREIMALREPRLRMAEDAHYLVNPGSVGQSRDGDPRAAFLIFDAEARTLEFLRVDYDVRRAREKAEKAGLVLRRNGLVERGIGKAVRLFEGGVSAVQRRFQ